MSEIRQMQEELVRMISDVDRLLNENGIQYTLLGGSVLGAVRHGGFIPWDDDMDIGIFRKDFARAEQLLSQIRPYQYEFADNLIIPDVPMGHLHFVNETYPIENSPTIDVFPLDTVPDNPRKWKKLRIIAGIRILVSIKRAPKNHGKFSKIVSLAFLKFAPKWLYGFLKRWSLKKILSYGNHGYRYTGNIFGAWTEREYFPTEVYAEHERKNFEGLLLPIPKDYNRYLSQLYGDYMKLPPEHERVPRHRSFP